jgi:hypothetical protein
MLFKQRHKEYVAKLVTTAVVMTSIFFMNAGTAFALVPTAMKDTLSREKVSVSAAHVLTMTLPTGGIPTGATLTVTYPGTFGTLTTTPDVVCGGGLATAGLGTTVLTITGGATACTGSLTVGGTTPFTSTNPSSPGSFVVTLGGTSITGSFAVTIVNDDQISITASIDPSITFNVGSQSSGTACSGSYSGNGGTVALGTLTTSAVATSDTSVANICSRLTTNAGSGAIVTVKSLNAALKSTAYTGDTIASSSATLVAGTSGYGICVGSGGGSSETGIDTTTPAGTAPVATSPFNGSCTTAAHAVGALTTGAQSIWSVAHASQNAYFKIYVKAAISGTVPAHSDYADTLTFIATATF